MVVVMENASFLINAHVHLDGMVQHVIQVGVSVNRKKNHNKNFIIQFKRNTITALNLLFLPMFKLFVVKVVSKVKGNVLNQMFAFVLMAGLEKHVMNPQPQP